MARFSDELQAKGNTFIIVVTHEPDIAEYAHRVQFTSKTGEIASGRTLQTRVR